MVALRMTKNFFYLPIFWSRSAGQSITFFMYQ